VFFFEKKNQKTFVTLLGHNRTPVAAKGNRTKSFWFFFFRKGTLPSGSC